MAGKSDFTEQEWEDLRKGATGAGLLVSVSDRGFFDTFKEANALAQHLSKAHAQSDSPLIRELAKGHERPFGVTASPQEIEQGTVKALQDGIAALEAKSPDDVAPYKALVTEVAQSVAEAAKGVSAQENAALDKIRATLDAA